MSETKANGLGLDQLTTQLKGEKSFVVDNIPPAPPELGTPPPTPEPIDTPPGDPIDPMKQKIDISDAIAKPVETSEPPAPKDTQDASLFAPFANVLREQGILTQEILDEIDVNSSTDLASAIQKVISSEAKIHTDHYINGRSEEARQFIEMIDAGVPLHQAKEISTQSVGLKQFDGDALSGDKALQEKAVKMYFQALNMEDAEIKDQLEYFADTDKLYDKAVGYVSKLKAHEAAMKERSVAQAEEQAAARKAAMKKDLADLRTTVYDQNEIVPGKPLNDAMKKKLFESITTPVGTDPNSGQPINSVALQRSKDPVGFEIKLHYLNALGVFEDKWDGIISSAKTDAAKDFEKALRTTKPVSGTTPVSSPEAEATSQKLVDSFKEMKRQLNKS